MKDTTHTDFDNIIQRTETYSSKWDKYSGTDILPFWVADMDLKTPNFIINSVKQRLRHPILGYTRRPEELNDTFIAWLKRNQNWEVKEEWLVWIPNVVFGLNIAAKSLAQTNGSIVVPTPVYYPFLSVAKNSGQHCVRVPLVKSDGQWVMNFDEIEKSIDANTNLLLLCNPQNPTGRCYSPSELARLAEICLKHGLYLCSDEIHCDLLIDENISHKSIASLGPEIGNRTITLFALTKTYNMPGLSCAVAVIPDTTMRNNFIRSQRGLSGDIGPLTLAATLAALADETNWVDQLTRYLRANHKLVLQTLGNRVTPVEATYLAWVDLRHLNVEKPASLLERYGIGLSEGKEFGTAGYVRMNFGCPKPLLIEGLRRFSKALKDLE
tara:strand:+ start:2562 stop:3707 length:1146 start_codon:yes stop_codon:yes gene_type:complete